MRKLLPILLPVVFLATGIAAAAYLVRTQPTLEPVALTERVWPVDTVTVRLADVQPQIQSFGKIYAAREIQLRALVPGLAVEVHPDLVEGGVIRRGETVLAIDEFEYRSDLADAEARLAEARARLAEREARRAALIEALKRDRAIMAVLARDLQRAEQLSARGNISDQALDRKRLELSRQDLAVVLRRDGIATEAARIEQERAGLKRLGVAVERARYHLERTRLRAPFDGIVRDAAVRAGQRLGVNDRIASMIDAGRLEARFHISDTQYGRLDGGGAELAGRKVRVIWRAGQREVVLDATVERIGARIEAASGGVELFARIANGEAAGSLRPGAFIEVLIPDRLYAGVARVPETVLRTDDTVYAVEDGRLVERRVTLVGRVGNDVLLRGDIADGMRLATAGSAAFAPGLRVEAR